MTYHVVIFDERIWNRDCKRIATKDLKKILKKIPQLQDWPVTEGIDVKALQSYDAADFRLRVGSYRVLFNKDDMLKAIYLLRVLHRSKLY